MLKKNEIIDALENGGSIMIDTIYRTARVLDANKDEIGTCRYDTAERIERAEGYKTRKTDWYATRFIEKDWDAASARVLAAVTDTFRALERAGVISDLTVEPLSAAECAELSAALDAAEEEEPAAEETPAQQPTAYLRADGEGATHSASEALSWHRAGHDLMVCHHGRAPVYVHGAPQETPREEDENRAHCRHIAEEIDAYAAGELKRCPDCGEIHRRDWDEIADAFRCPNCGAVGSVDDWETLSLWEFFDDAYDIEYRVTGRARDSLRSVCVMVACGGPNIYVDTASKAVELYWWSERASYPISWDAVEIINEWAEELWSCL